MDDPFTKLDDLCPAARQLISAAGSPNSAIDIEQPELLLTYLRAQGILAPEDRPLLRTLVGAVSNGTLLMEPSRRMSCVVKQALSCLRASVDWRADPERIHRESRPSNTSLNSLRPARSAGCCLRIAVGK